MSNKIKKIKENFPVTKSFFVKSIKKTGSVLATIFEKITSFASAAGWVCVVLLCIITVFICISYIQLSTGNFFFLNSFKFLNMCSQFLNFGDIITNEKITVELIQENFDAVKSTLEFTANLLVAVIGIALSIGTLGSYFMKLRAVRHKASFQKREIHETGVDDIKIMLKYYKGADMVKIYSGTFGWVRKNKEMKETLMNLAEANKLSLFAPDLVVAKKNLCGMDGLLTHLHITTVNLRFSYIERDNAKYLLYRQEEQKQQQLHTYVITVCENIESTYLLRVISKLMG